MGVPKAKLLFEIHVVNEFADVFPNELPRSPPICQTEFAIKLQSNTTPIFKAPYDMTSKELEDLKV